jgi:NAD(P)-dependent dehydrogenase (short-subunit alcohol dehydrogenase family)
MVTSRRHRPSAASAALAELAAPTPAALRKASAPAAERRAAAATVRQQRGLQKAQDKRDASHSAPSSSRKAVQAGPRSQPVRQARQHQTKPGRESALVPAPRYEAPYYRGSGKLQDRVALITGADSGIGRAVAVLFAREGADIAAAYLSADDDAEVTRRAVEAEGRRCLLLKGDVKRSTWCGLAVRRTVARFGRLDVLVNNAAFQLHAASLEDIDDARLRETLETNIGGCFRLTRAALPHLQQGAAIINTGSVVGLRGSAQLLDYAATKGAIHAFTKSLASNLLSRGIRVNAVAPGPVWTPLNAADRPAHEVASFGSTSDMRRPAQPEELSPAFVFLASPVTASYITGIVLPVTGSVDAI